MSLISQHFFLPLFQLLGQSLLTKLPR